jgi:hypothetical protein
MGEETAQVCFRDTMDKGEMMLGPLEAEMEGGGSGMGSGSGMGMGMDIGMGSGSGSGSGMRRLQEVMPPAAPAAPAAPGACEDDHTWVDEYGDTCAWYAEHDPGCTYYSPAPSYGQFEKCKATCNTCTTGPNSFCPPGPVITQDGSTETIEYCLPPEEHFAVFGPGSEGQPFVDHLVTKIKAAMSRTDETDMILDFSFTGPDSPEFELRGELALSG